MKLGKVFVTIAAFLLLAEPVVVLANNKVPDDAKFGKFAIMPNVSIEMGITYNGGYLNTSDDGFTQVDYDPVLENFPLPGWRTFKVNMFSGGANCCMAYYLLSQKGDSAVAAYLPPADQYLVMVENKRLSLSDPYFKYYSPDFGDNVAKVELTRVDSPHVSRLLVFENNKWRVDKPGEFAAVYEKWIRQLDSEKDMAPFARDISVAYYMLMAGQGTDAARARFMKNPYLPYQNAYARVFEDIEKAVQEFNPIQGIELGP